MNKEEWSAETTVRFVELKQQVADLREELAIRRRQIQSTKFHRPCLEDGLKCREQIATLRAEVERLRAKERG